jgi:hypothetical protein
MKQAISRWSLVPALTLAGLLSGIYTFLYILLVHFAGKYRFARVRFVGVSFEAALFVLLASISFALSIAAVLWFYRRIQSWKSVTALIAVIVAAHLLTLLGDRWTFGNDLNVPLIGTIVPNVLVSCFVSSFILMTVCLFLCASTQKAERTLRIALVCSALAAVTVAFVDGQEWSFFWRGNTLDILWQVSLSFFIGIALVVTSPTAKEGKVDASEPRSSSRTRFALLVIVLAYFVAIGVWGHFADSRGRHQGSESFPPHKAIVSKAEIVL